MNRLSNFTVAYLPNEEFFRFPSGVSSNKASFLLLFCGLNTTLPIFIRAGAILPFQETKNVKSSKDLDNRFKLFVSLRDGAAAEGFFIGFQEFSAENLENCQKNEFQCLWSMQFEAVSQSFMRLSVFQGKSLRNSGNVVFDAIEICGLEEKLANSLSFQGKGRIFRSFQENFTFEREFRVETAGNKLVFLEINIAKTLLYDEEFFFVFERENEETLNVYFLMFSSVFFLCLHIFCIFSEKN